MQRSAFLVATVLTIGSLAVAAEPATVAAPTTAPSADTVALKYNDGTAEGKRSYGSSGEMIEFTMPEGYTTLTGISIHGSRYGMPQPPKESFMIYIMDEEHASVLHTEKAPYRLFNRGEEKWVTVRFAKPLAVAGKFWIGLDFMAHQTKGVYVSFDSSTGGNHSRVGTPATESRPVEFAGDWMVQAMVGR